MTRLHRGDLTQRGRFSLNRSDQANAERQSSDTVAHCGKHSESLKKSSKILTRLV
jgi:hypothetical protein